VAPVMTVVLALVTIAQTSTTAAPRVVGDPLPAAVVVGFGLALLAVILLAGLIAKRRH